MIWGFYIWDQWTILSAVATPYLQLNPTPSHTSPRQPDWTFYNCEKIEINIPKWKNASSASTCTMSVCEKVRSVFCDICQQIILGDTLKRHISYKHVQDRQTKCQLCSKDFVGKEHLKSHMIQHSDSRDFKCDLCEKRFNRKANLTSHLRTHREEGRQFQCKLCPKVSNKPISKSHMVQHINEHPVNAVPVGNLSKIPSV